MLQYQKWMRMAALVPLIQLAGCATLTVSLDPAAKDAGVKGGARVFIRGNTEGIRVFREDGTPMRVVMTEDPTFRQALANEARRVSAEQSGAATYQTTTRLSPTIWLDTKQDHRLRLVRPDGSSVTVTRNGRIGKKYFIADWLLSAPTMFLSLGIDWATGKWVVFDEINVDEEFRRASTSSGAAR